MEKIVVPSSWDFGEAIVKQVKMASAGLKGHDLSVLVKRAGAEFADKVSHIIMEPGEVPMHVIAMGATEGFGPNRNGDGFKEAALIRTHQTFLKNAKYYRHHKNKDKKISYGEVKLAFYNKPMRRVELLLGLNGTKELAEKRGTLVADKELDKIASGDDLAVSMACFTDPEFPILTKDRGYVGIANIRVGDEVWTAERRWKPVTKLNRRKYSGAICTLETNGLPFPLEVTADHPMLSVVFSGSRETAAVKSKAARYFKDTATFESAKKDWYHAECIGVGDRLLHAPIGRYPGFGALIDENMAAVCGYYAAEGSLQWNGEKPSTVVFTCNWADSAVRRIPKILQQLYPDTTVEISPKENSTEALDLLVHSSSLAAGIHNWFKAGCKSKLIAPEIFNASREVKLAFLGAWLDGDGWLDKKGIHWSTASVNLVLQGRDLLANLGIPSSIYKIDHTKCATSGYKGSGVEYTLNVCHLESWQLAGHSQKISEYPTVVSKRQKPATMRLCPDGLYALRVKKHTTSYVSDVTVYNFEVEGDESYSAAGLISHNCQVPNDVCSGCGNKARTRKDYCTEDTCKYGGCKSNLTKVANDGHILHVDNPDPSFFDISGVFNPADRIAYGNTVDFLRKAAGCETIGGAALAEAYSLVPPVDSLLRGYISERLETQIKAAYVLAAREDSYESLLLTKYADTLALAFRSCVQPETDLKPLGTVGTAKCASGLRALADTDSVLPVRDFLRLALGQNSEKLAALTAEVPGLLPGVYNRLIAGGSLVSELESNCLVPSQGSASGEQKLWAGKVAEDLSIAPENVMRRIQLSAIRGDTSPAQPQTFHKKASSSDLAEVWARRYAVYKLASFAGKVLKEPLTADMLVRQNYSN